MSERIATDRAPRALGPYAQAVVAGDLVFCAGQVGIDPATGALVPGGVAAETARVCENLAAVLAAVGLGLADVVKTTVYVVDLGDFASLNEVYGRYFTAPHPARATVQVAGLPAGARVEIEAIAARSRWAGPTGLRRARRRGSCSPRPRRCGSAPAGSPRAR